MKCEGCGREGTLEPVQKHHGHVHVRCRVCGWKCVRTHTQLSNSIEASVIFQRGRKVVIVKPKLKDWIGGVTIICKRCGNVEIVNEGSLCDSWKLCTKCAQERLKTIIK